MNAGNLHFRGLTYRNNPISIHDGQYPSVKAAGIWQVGCAQRKKSDKDLDMDDDRQEMQWATMAVYNVNESDLGMRAT